MSPQGPLGNDFTFAGSFANLTAVIEAILFASSFVPEDNHSASACYQSERQCFTVIVYLYLCETLHTTVRMQKCWNAMHLA